MLTKHQAEMISDSLMDRARSEARIRKNKAARRIPVFFRFPEFDGLEPWEQAEEISAAFKFATRKPAVIAAWVISVLIAFTITTWLFSLRHEIGSMPIIVAAFPSILPALLYRRHVMRKFVSARAASRRERRERRESVD